MHPHPRRLGVRHLPAGDRVSAETTDELTRLRALEARRVLESRARKAKALRRIEGNAAAARGEMRRAKQLMRGIPKDNPYTIAVRRAVLSGIDGQSIRDLAAAILANLPPDPDAAQHQLDLIAAVYPKESTEYDLSPWRTPAEAAWTDAQLRRAAVLRRKGDRQPETLEVDRAYQRVMRRRLRGSI